MSNILSSKSYKLFQVNLKNYIPACQIFMRLLRHFAPRNDVGYRSKNLKAGDEDYSWIPTYAGTTDR